MEEHLAITVPCLVKLKTPEDNELLYATRNMSANNYLAPSGNCKDFEYVIVWLI